MQKRQTWRYALVALCLGLAGAAWADETWHVTAGDEHETWTLKRSANNNLMGGGTITDAAGSTVSAMVLGGDGQLLVSAPGLTCTYAIRTESAVQVSGDLYCGKEQGTWSATIDNPTDMTPPVLLTSDDENPRDSAAYAALDADMKSKVEDEAKDFVANMEPEYAFMNIRNPDCLVNQYLNIRLQKPDWTRQNILEFIQLTCVVPAKVHDHAAETCAKLYPPTPRLKDDIGNNPEFCPCYADTYTEKFVAAPNVSGAYETVVGVDSVAVCRRRLAEQR